MIQVYGPPGILFRFFHVTRPKKKAPASTEALVLSALLVSFFLAHLDDVATNNNGECTPRDNE
jgi:hypothetical protein